MNLEAYKKRKEAEKLAAAKAILVPTAAIEEKLNGSERLERVQLDRRRLFGVPRIP